MYEKITPPNIGSRITFKDGEPIVPDNPILPFIRGDGTGVDIWPAAQKVFDAAVQAAYGDKRQIVWFKIYAGDEACEKYGTYQYLPEDTLQAIQEYGIAIKGPLTTPIGGGIRSLNVALRQINDIYACVRPCKYYPGTPSPHKSTEKLDVIIYRENTEDIYLGIEWRQGTEMADKLISLLKENKRITVHTLGYGLTAEQLGKNYSLGHDATRKDIGIGAGKVRAEEFVDEQRLKQIANATRGIDEFSPDAEAVTDKLKVFLNALLGEYEITYTQPNAERGSKHEIGVVVQSDKSEPKPYTINSEPKPYTITVFGRSLPLQARLLMMLIVLVAMGAGGAVPFWLWAKHLKREAQEA